MVQHIRRVTPESTAPYTRPSRYKFSKSVHRFPNEPSTQEGPELTAPSPATATGAISLPRPSWAVQTNRHLCLCGFLRSPDPAVALILPAMFMVLPLDCKSLWPKLSSMSANLVASYTDEGNFGKLLNYIDAMIPQADRRQILLVTTFLFSSSRMP